MISNVVDTLLKNAMVLRQQRKVFVLESSSNT